MNLHLIYILGSFLISTLCGSVFIPWINSFCKRKRLYDLPNERKVHTTLVPRLGGICFLPCMLLAFILAMTLLDAEGKGRQLSVSLWTMVFCISLLLIYFIGVVDDLVGVEAKMKFLVQIVAAIMMPYAGLYINDLYGLFGVHAIPFFIGAPLTVFAIVFVCNSINLLDGIDGLASGISLLALCGFLGCFWSEGIWIYCVLIAGLMGVVLPFMYFNIFGKEGKNKIFMGDTGSLTLGFILSFLMLKMAVHNPHVLRFPSYKIMLALSFLLIPIFDACRMIVVRWVHKKPLFGADKNHIHHKVMRMGLSQHQTLLFILGMAIFFVVLNGCVINNLNINVIVLVDVVVWCLIQQVINYLIRKNRSEVFLSKTPTA